MVQSYKKNQPECARVIVEHKLAPLSGHGVQLCTIECSDDDCVCIGLFVMLTLTAVAAVVVFWRKSNTVFALQKCEQRDIDDQVNIGHI